MTSKSSDIIKKYIENFATSIKNIESYINQINISSVDVTTKNICNQNLTSIVSIEDPIKKILNSEKLKTNIEKYKNTIDDIVNYFQTEEEFYKNFSKSLSKKDTTSTELAYLDAYYSAEGALIKNKFFTDLKSGFDKSISTYLNSISYIDTLGGVLQTNVKYPWVYYIDYVNNIIDKIEEINIDVNSSSDSKKIENYNLNFIKILKKVYLILKLQLRNSSVLRLMDMDNNFIDEVVDNVSQRDTLKQYKHIINNLIYISIDSTSIIDPTSLSELNLKEERNYPESFIKGKIGVDKYRKFVNRAKTDSVIYKSYNKITDDGIYINSEYLLKTFIDVTDSKDFDINKYNTNIEFYNSVIKTLMKIIYNIHNMSDLSNIISEKPNIASATLIKDTHNKKNDIYTFVKIRSNQENEINDRFQVSLDKNSQVMLMRYNPYKGYKKKVTEKKVTEKKDEKVSGTKDDKVKTTTTTTTTEIETKTTNDNIIEYDKDNPYPHNYIFGPFTHIFKQGEKNDVIASSIHMEPLLDKLKRGQSVCVIGYGSSGSGKTSTLINASYNNLSDSEKDGVIINMCNKMLDTYDELEVSFIEMYGDVSQINEEQASKNRKILSYRYNIKTGKEESEENEELKKLNEKEKDKIKYFMPHYFLKEKDEVTDTDIWKYSDVKKSKTDCCEDIETDLEFKNTSTSDIQLREYIIKIMEEKRIIEATTNNPVSSRSHVILFVRFKKQGANSPYLICCDFAGVENKFNCSNREVLTDFRNIKKEKSKTETFYGERLKLSVKNITDEIERIKKEQEELKGNSIYSSFKNIVLDESDNLNLPLVVITDLLKSLSPINQYKSTDVNMSYIQKININNFIEDINNKIDKENPNPDRRSLDEKKNSRYYNLKHIKTDDVIKFLLQLFTLDNVSKRLRVKLNIPSPEKNSRLTLSNNLGVFMNYLRNISQASGAKDPERGHIQKINTFNKFLTDYKKYTDMINTELNGHRQIIDLENQLEHVVQKELQIICGERVKEGQFINDSLESLRKFISYFILHVQNGGKSIIPKFADECLPIQCNPNYEDCFGSLEYVEQYSGNSVIAEEIRKVLCCRSQCHGSITVSDTGTKTECSIPSNVDICYNGDKTKLCDEFKNMTFCIFNVINLSTDVNNPPPVPYIDISNLVNEKNRIESNRTIFRDEFKKSTYRKDKPLLENNIPKNPELNNLRSKLNDDSVDITINEKYLKELENNSLMSYLQVSDKDSIMAKIKYIRKISKDNHDKYQVLNELNNLIRLVNNSNAVSTLGTMEFVDMISKYGTNRNVCNYKLKNEDSGINNVKEKLLQDDTNTKSWKEEKVFLTKQLENYKNYLTNLAKEESILKR